MNFSLTPQMEKYIAKLVKSGQYQTASEVVREALRVLKEHELMKQMRLAELRRKIQVGEDQIKRGEISNWDAESIKSEGRRILAERSQRRRKAG